MASAHPPPIHALPPNPASEPDAGELSLGDEEAAFHLPVSGLFADMETGSGLVSLPQVFHQQTLAWRMQVLNDWIAALQAQRADLEQTAPAQPGVSSAWTG